MGSGSFILCGSVYIPLTPFGHPQACAQGGIPVLCNRYKYRECHPDPPAEKAGRCAGGEYPTPVFVSANLWVI